MTLLATDAGDESLISYDVNLRRHGFLRPLLGPLKYSYIKELRLLLDPRTKPTFPKPTITVNLFQY